MSKINNNLLEVNVEHCCEFDSRNAYIVNIMNDKLSETITIVEYLERCVF